MPDRFQDNLGTGYARFYPYPKNARVLSRWIDEAFDAREDSERRKLIKNGRVKMKRNRNENNDLAGRSKVVPIPDGSSPSGRRDSGRSSGVAVGPVSRSVTPRSPYCLEYKAGCFSAAEIPMAIQRRYGVPACDLHFYERGYAYLTIRI